MNHCLGRPFASGNEASLIFFGILVIHEKWNEKFRTWSLKGPSFNFWMLLSKKKWIITKNDYAPSHAPLNLSNLPQSKCNFRGVCPTSNTYLPSKRI
jgi:hypothetical protein